MKIPAYLTFLVAALLSFLPLSQARAGDVSFDVFYNSLGDQGDWYNTPEYGYVWQPSIAYQNDKWRPYSDGYWAQTDDGWTWVSYEDFGWATYHYGRWTRLEGTGWVWVPGYDWGPGWVSWRTNDDCVGWAPLPPKRECSKSTGGDAVSVDYNTVECDEGYSSNVDEQYDIGPGNYCFVQVADFGAPVLREVILPPERNILIIENSYNCTNISYRRNPGGLVIYNDGPSFEFLRTRVHQPIQQLRIERRTDPAYFRDAGGHRNPNVVRDGVFRIAAPNINHQQVNFTQVRPPTVKRDIRDVKVEHGWRNTGADQATVQRVRDQVKDQGRNRDQRPPNPNDSRRAPERMPVAPSPGANTTPGGQRTDEDRRNRRDAAQRARDTRETGRNINSPSEFQPTPGAQDQVRTPGPTQTQGGRNGRDRRTPDANADAQQPTPPQRATQTKASDADRRAQVQEAQDRARAQQQQQQQDRAQKHDQERAARQQAQQQQQQDRAQKHDQERAARQQAQQQQQQDRLQKQDQERAARQQTPQQAPQRREQERPQRQEQERPQRQQAQQQQTPRQERQPQERQPQGKSDDDRKRRDQ